LRVGDGRDLEISHIGSTCLVTNFFPLVLHNVLHVPLISKPLLSISRLIHDNPVYVEFNESSCLIKDRASHRILLEGTLSDDLYILSA
jgi:hypothetical protein